MKTSAGVPVIACTRLAGSNSTATLGMHLPASARHNGVAGKSASHQVRQRCTVRREAPKTAPSCAAAGDAPARCAEPNTIASATNTRRPRKRTEREVQRLRQREQQKLNREEYSWRVWGGQPRGLRG